MVSTNVLLTGLIALIAFVLIVGAALSVAQVRGKGRWWHGLVVGALVVLFGTGVSCLTPNTLFDWGEFYLFDKQGNLVKRVPEGLAMSILDPIYQRGYAVKIRSDYAVICGMAVQPITPNPKLRDLHYDFEAVIGPDLEAYGHYIAKFGAPMLDKYDENRVLKPPRLNSKDINNFVRSLLYELNERHSRDLAEFYNPLDDEQQKRFSNLVRQFIEEDLRKVGLQIRSVRFSLP